VLFITHDFGVVAEIADRVVVLRKGEVVEAGAARDVLTSPREAYTRMLIASVPSLTPRRREPVESPSSCERRTCPRSMRAARGSASRAIGWMPPST
jgi:peptide/nickel transport system ATP-binding protein